MFILVLFFFGFALDFERKESCVAKEEIFLVLKIYMFVVFLLIFVRVFYSGG